MIQLISNFFLSTTLCYLLKQQEFAFFYRFIVTFFYVGTPAIRFLFLVYPQKQNKNSKITFYDKYQSMVAQNQSIAYNVAKNDYCILKNINFDYRYRMEAHLGTAFPF